MRKEVEMCALCQPSALLRMGEAFSAAGPRQTQEVSTDGLPTSGMAGLVDCVDDFSNNSTQIDCDLSNEGLESHHMVMVMAVLLSCPHIR